MKIISLFMMMLAAASSATAQQPQPKPITSGSVSYSETIPLNISNVEGLPKEILDQIPKENITRKILLFNDSVSLYHNDKKVASENQSIESESGNMQFLIKSSEEDEILFTSLNKNEITESKEFFGKIFLIKRPVGDAAPWKVLTEQKDILGFPCQKAVIDKDSMLIEAWFTSMIPVPIGPQGYGGLPGLILQFRMKTANSDMQIVATAVNLETPDVSLLVEPKTGKKVTSQQFEKIVTEKNKEIQQEFGGGSSNVIIKVQH